ncbi:MAG: DUF2807 domain-containing protein [Proteobacteria bacterium]|nr:DUF2807 domain-containing protein [Pseudomonadota bacterium]
MRLILVAALLASPAAAAERSFSVTSFDRIRVEGPFVVTVATGKAVSARVSGDDAAIERVSLRVEGRTMLIRPNLSSWGGYPGKSAGAPRIMLTTPDLSTAILIGSGSLDIDKMKGMRITLTAEGSGRITVHQLDADNASLAIAGAGALEVSGKARQAAAVARGTAEIRAGDLIVSDLTLTTESAGAVRIQASRSAKVSAMGIGAVEVTGGAACEVKQTGGGPVRCGR